MAANNLSPDLQSAYRTNRSTETALFRVKNDLQCIAEHGQGSQNLTCHVRSQCSEDHGILLHRLQFKLGLRGKALYVDKCNLTELTTKSACVPLVVSGVDRYAHASEFHVLVDRTVRYVQEEFSGVW